MLRKEDIELERGRASHGGDFLRLTHVPSNISRYHPGPMSGIDQQSLIQSWGLEIEGELCSKGLLQYVVDAETA